MRKRDGFMAGGEDRMPTLHCQVSHRFHWFRRTDAWVVSAVVPVGSSWARAGVSWLWHDDPSPLQWQHNAIESLACMPIASEHLVELRGVGALASCRDPWCARPRKGCVRHLQAGTPRPRLHARAHPCTQADLPQAMPRNRWLRRRRARSSRRENASCTLALNSWRPRAAFQRSRIAWLLDTSHEARRGGAKDSSQARLAAMPMAVARSWCRCSKSGRSPSRFGDRKRANASQSSPAGRAQPSAMITGADRAAGRNRHVQSCRSASRRRRSNPQQLDPLSFAPRHPRSLGGTPVGSAQPVWHPQPCARVRRSK